MKIILTQEVNRLGKIGDIVNVKDGYARNYLFPKNIAQEATIRSLQARLDVCEGRPPNLACKADLSGDGVVNFRDLGLFKSVFFKKCEPTP